MWPTTLATFVIIVGFGVLTGRDAARVEANLPTPWTGLWERIDIMAFLAMSLRRLPGQADDVHARHRPQAHVTTRSRHELGNRSTTVRLSAQPSRPGSRPPIFTGPQGTATGRWLG